MTHIGVDPELSNNLNISEKMVRMSIGVENPDDIIEDIKQALEEV